MQFNFSLFSCYSTIHCIESGKNSSLQFVTGRLELLVSNEDKILILTTKTIYKIT